MSVRITSVGDNQIAYVRDEDKVGGILKEIYDEWIVEDFVWDLQPESKA